MHSPDIERFGAINLGMPCLEFDVPVGKAKGIVRFYQELFGAQTKLEGNGAGKVAYVNVGASARRARPRSPMTATTSRSTSRISPAPIKS
jgi:hypothetical protein